MEQPNIETILFILLYGLLYEKESRIDLVLKILLQSSRLIYDEI